MLRPYLAGCIGIALAGALLAQDKPADPPPGPAKAAPAQDDSGAKPADAKPVAGGIPKISLSADHWDFGTIEYGEKVDFVLTVKNEGTADLKIKEARGSCACTVPQRGIKDVLKPGETTEIKIHFNSTKKQGIVTTFVTVETNDPVNPRAEFRIHGTVKTIIDAIPAQGFTLRGTSKDQVLTGTVRLVNRSDATFKPAIQGVAAPNLDVELKEIAAGKEYELIARTKPPMAYGPAHGTVSVSTGIEKMPTLTVSVSTRVQERVALMPPVVLVPKDAKDATTRELALRYFGDAPDFQVLEAKASDAGVAVEVKPATKPNTPDSPSTGTMIRPTLIVPVSVVVAAGAKLPAEGAKIAIKTNDGEFGELSLTVTDDPALAQKLAGVRTLNPQATQMPTAKELRQQQQQKQTEELLTQLREMQRQQAEQREKRRAERRAAKAAAAKASAAKPASDPPADAKSEPAPPKP